MAKKAAFAFSMCLKFALLVTTVQYCSECSLPWKSFRGNCYLLIGTPKSFWDAEGYCKSLSRQGRDAHLVSVSDQQEEGFIEEYSGPFGMGQVRIGFTLNYTTDEYYWVDGSESEYKDWAGSEPSKNGDDCAILKHASEWDDRGCDNPYPFICKIPGRYGDTQ